MAWQWNWDALREANFRGAERDASRLLFALLSTVAHLLLNEIHVTENSRAWAQIELYEKIQVSIVSVQCNRWPYSRDLSFHLKFCDAKEIT